MVCEIFALLMLPLHAQTGSAGATGQVHGKVVDITGGANPFISNGIVLDGINAVLEKRECGPAHRKVAPELVVRELTRTLA